MYIYMYIYIHVCTCIYICKYIYIYIYTYMPLDHPLALTTIIDGGSRRRPVRRCVWRWERWQWRQQAPPRPVKC